MKKILLIVLPILVVMILVFSFLYAKPAQKVEEPETMLLTTFNNSGIKTVSREVYFWSRIDNNLTNSEKLKQVADAIVSETGILKNEKYSEKSVKNDYTEKVEISGECPDQLAVDLCVQLYGAELNGAERYITVNLVEGVQNKELEAVKEKVLKALHKLKISPRINTCITGSFDGKLENSKLNEICGNIFKDVEAQKVDGIKDRNLISVTAYSPIMGDSVSVNGSKVNLNIAIRYNSFEDKTYIWAATPVITTEY